MSCQNEICNLLFSFLFCFLEKLYRFLWGELLASFPSGIKYRVFSSPRIVAQLMLEEPRLPYYFTNSWCIGSEVFLSDTLENHWASATLCLWCCCSFIASMILLVKFLASCPPDFKLNAFFLSSRPVAQTKVEEPSLYKWPNSLMHNNQIWYVYLLNAGKGL